MGLVPGARARLSDLLVGMLLPSGNDAAVAVAEAVDGTVEQFVAHMDSRGRELGLVSTHFRNAEGLDLPGHVSSAADIARVALLDMNYPRFNAVVRTSSLRISAPDGTVYDLTNLNQLLGSYPGSDGVKTGTTPGAGQNLVATVTRSGHRLLLVVMGSDDRYDDARKMLDYGWSHWQWIVPALPPFVSISIAQTDGDAVIPLALRSARALPLASWRTRPLGYRLSLPGSVDASTGHLVGDVGTATVLIGDDALAALAVGRVIP